MAARDKKIGIQLKFSFISFGLIMYLFTGIKLFAEKLFHLKCKIRIMKKT